MCGSEAKAQIAVDNTSSYTSPGAQSIISWSHTVGSGSNRILVVGFSNHNAGSRVVNYVRFNGVDLTRLVSVGGCTVAFMEMWYMVNPPSGTYTVTISYQKSHAVAGGISFTGVNQSTPFGTPVSTTGTSANPSVTVNSAVGEVVLDTLFADNATAVTATAGAGQTQRWNGGDGTNARGAGSTEPGASTVTMDWTLSGSRCWALGAVPIRPAQSPLNAPSSLSSTTVSNSQINLNWTDNSSDETGFKIERKTGVGGTYAEIATVGAGVTTYNNTGLSASTNYYYRVRAYNAGSDSSYSNEANSTTAPAAPSGLASTTISNSQINLSWTDNSSDETGFKIERKTGVSGTYSQIATVGAGVTTYNNTGLSASTNYYYRVRAYNAGGDSSYSNEANSTTAPAAPSGLTATAASTTQINLNWTDNSSNETGFKIERKTGVGGTYAEIATVGAGVTTYNNTGLTASTNYYYRVRSYNADGNSSYSAEANATTAPTAPSGLSAATVSDTQINLSWVDNSSDETGFRIERKIGSGGTYAEIATVGAGVTTYNNTGLTASTNYFYRVRAYSSSGNSAYSAEANATTAPAAPSALTVIAVSPTHVVLNWADNSSDETGFKIERKTGSSGTYSQIAMVGAGITRYTNSVSTTTDVYYYRVRAYNSNGDSSYSNEVNSTTTPTHNAQFVSQSVPTTMITGQTYNVSVTMKNTGTNTWTFAESYRLGSQNPNDNSNWGFNRVALPSSVAPNANVTFNFTVTAPNTPGTYNFQWRMVHELTLWFGDLSSNVAVDVGSLPNSPSGLTATAVSSTQINLSWTDNSTDETGFKIERKSEMSGTYAEIATVGASISTFSDTGLSAATNYFYRIRSYNSNGDSSYSNEAGATAEPEYSISGNVFEDVNYGGGAGRSKAVSSGVGRSAARVELYNAGGNFVTLTTTDANGNYTFGGLLGNGNSYTVRVVNSSVSSSRSGYTASNLAVQTYRTNVASGSVVAVTDRVGGEDPIKTDAGNGSTTLAALTSGSNTPQSITTVIVNSANITGVDFGFNFNTIVNTNNDGQGSLRQFIVNANSLSNAGLAQSGQTAGKEVSIFMISDGASHPGLRAGLTNQLIGGVAVIAPATQFPNITDADTTIDGTTQTNNVGNTNSGSLGTGGTVGVSALSLPTVSRPEVQITGVNSIGYGFYVQANNVTIRGLALYGFGDRNPFGEANISIANNFTGTLIENNVIGSTATNFTDPGAGVRTGADNIVSMGADNGTIRNNLIGFSAYMGALMTTGSTGWLVEGNEVRGNGIGNPNQDGVSIEQANSGSAIIRGNLIVGGEGAGVDSANGLGSNTIVNNTITGNGTGSGATLETPGVRLWGTNNVVDRNIISGNVGAGVMVTTSSTQNTITKNSIFNNGTTTGQIGIDLLNSTDLPKLGTAPFVTLNDANDTDTGGNNLLNSPVLTGAVIANGNLTVTGYARPGAEIELFIAAPDASGFGEGQTFLTTLIEGSGADTDAGTGTYTNPVNGLNQGTDTTNKFSFTIPLPGGVNTSTSLTATATVAGSTSEFSGNITAAILPPNISLVMSVNPLGAQLPGTDLTYTIDFTNGGGQSSANFVLTALIPANTDFKIGSEVNNLGSTGLSVTHTYSNDGGTTYAYTPASGGGGAQSGYDRNVTHMRCTFTGNLSHTAPNNTGNISFIVRIQ